MSKRSPTTGPPAPGSREAPLSISQLNGVADGLLQQELGGVWVEGEITRFTAHRSGHWYFTLKDEQAAVSCAMFRNRNQRVRFLPEDGQQVLVLAGAGIYAVQGRYQLIVQSIEPRGAGADALALAQLRKRLSAEGLFSTARKRPLPATARHLAVVTSEDGAALRDVVRVLRHRGAGLRLSLVPCAVQGAQAPGAIVDAIGIAGRCGAELVLLVRGGGSREDLAAFDDERVVRAVAACPVPVISGIGHEIDTSLADLAADAAAPTPSAAAALAVRDRREMRSSLRSLARALMAAQSRRLERLRLRLDRFAASRGLTGIPALLDRRRLRLGDAIMRLERETGDAIFRRRENLRSLSRRLTPRSLREGFRGKLRRLGDMRRRLAEAQRTGLSLRGERLARAAGRLDALSPLGILSRGYTLVQRGDAEGELVRHAAGLAVGDLLHLRFARGAALARVLSVSGDEGPGAEEST